MVKSKNIRAIAALFLLAALALASCDFLMGPDDPAGDSGNLIINVPGGARNAVPGAETLDAVEYQITAVSGFIKESTTLAAGATTWSLTVSPGVWDITAEAYLPDGHVHVGTGTAQANAVLGQTSHVNIQMVFDNTDLESVIATGNDNVPYTGTWDGTDYTVVVPGTVTRVTILATPKVVDADISYSQSDNSNPPKGLVTSFPGSLIITVSAGAGYTASYTVHIQAEPGGVSEDTPNAAINYIDETLSSLTADAAYTVNSVVKTADSSGAIALESGWFGATVSIVKTGGATTTDSPPQSLVVPARPGAPTGLTGGEGKITGTTTAMEYSANGTSGWLDCTVPETTMSPGSYYVRVKQESSNFVSINAGPITVGAVSITDASITGLAEPVTGNTGVTTVGAGAATYTVRSLSWNPTVSGTFAAATQYTATVTLKANAGYQFESDITPTTNLDTTIAPVSDVVIGTEASENILSFEVEFAETAAEQPPPNPNLTITPPTFDAVAYGYTRPAAQAVTISNNGTAEATISLIELSGQGADAFELGGSGNTVNVSDSITTRTIQPVAGLAAGTHTATITVTYDDNATTTADVSITVGKLTLTATAAATDRAYNETLAVDVTITPTNLVGSDVVTLTAKGVAENPANVGSRTVTIYDISELAGADAANYNAPESIPNTTVTISLATLSTASIGNLGLVAPATGEAASTATGGISTGTGYTVQLLSWWTQGGTSFTGTFAPSANYTAQIVLLAGANYTFSGTITPTTDLPVETHPVSVGTITGNGAGNTLTFTVDFPATAGGTAAIITAWVDGETIATSADGTPPIITRTAGDATNASLTINVIGATYDTYAWTVKGAAADTADVTNDGKTFTFDATWKSNGAYNIGLSVTKDGKTYSTTITVTVQD